MLDAGLSDFEILVVGNGNRTIAKGGDVRTPGKKGLIVECHAVKVLKASIKSDGRAAADADDVYEWGTAQMTVERDGKTKQASGRYLTVWHRSGKQWVITHNIAF